MVAKKTTDSKKEATHKEELIDAGSAATDNLSIYEKQQRFLNGKSDKK